MKSLATFILLQFADVGTTMFGLNHGSHEVNPVIHSLMGIFGVSGGLIAAKVLFCMGILYFGRKKMGWVNLAFFLLVVWNLNQLLGVI